MLITRGFFKWFTTGVRRPTSSGSFFHLFHSLMEFRQFDSITYFSIFLAIPLLFPNFLNIFLMKRFPHLLPYMIIILWNEDRQTDRQTDSHTAIQTNIFRMNEYTIHCILNNVVRKPALRLQEVALTRATENSQKVKKEEASKYFTKYVIG